MIDTKPYCVFCRRVAQLYLLNKLWPPIFSYLISSFQCFFKNALTDNNQVWKFVGVETGQVLFEVELSNIFKQLSNFLLLNFQISLFFRNIYIFFVHNHIILLSIFVIVFVYILIQPQRDGLYLML